MSEFDDIADEFAKIPDIDFSIIGTFVRFEGLMAVVNVGGTQVTIPNVGMYFPVPNDSVRIIRIGKHTFLWGPAVARSPVGRVSATGTPRCTVEYPNGSGVTKLMGYPSNVTPAVNDIVLIDWTSGGTVIDKITAAPVNLVPDDPGNTSPGTAGRQVFRAVDSGSYGTNWFTHDIYDSTSNLGAWFYGSQIADTIPDNAVITSVAICLTPRSTQYAAPKLRVHTAAQMGSLTFTGASHTLSGTSGYVSVPTAVGDLLKANKYGVGFEPNTGGYNIFKSVWEDGASGSLDISWTTP